MIAIKKKDILFVLYLLIISFAMKSNNLYSQEKKKELVNKKMSLVRITENGIPEIKIEFENVEKNHL